MKVLITGGAGYIGYDLVRALHPHSSIQEIRVYDNLSRSGHHFFMGSKKLPKVRFVKADILDSHTLERALEDVEIVFHLAAYVSQPYNHLQNLQYEQVNRWGTLNLCRAIREQKTVKKCIYLSSTAVFGFGNIENIHAQAAPTNAYGESKFHAEEYIKTLPDRCSAHIIRSANVFGYNPCTRLDNILNKWIFSALTENKITIYGNGEQKRGFVPIHRVVDDLISIINTENTSGEPTTSMLFSASLNQLKSWLQSAIPSLEYRYLNRNQNFPSQEFPAYPFREEHREVLNRHLEKMKSIISIVQ